MLVPTGVQFGVDGDEYAKLGAVGAYGRAIEKAKRRYREKFPDGPEPSHIQVSNKLTDEDIAAILQQSGLHEMTNDKGTPHRYGLRAVWVGAYVGQEKTFEDGKWYDIKSGNLHSARWEPGNLGIRFKSDPSVTYVYSGNELTKDMFVTLLHVPSAGSWFEANIKERFPYRKYSADGAQVEGQAANTTVLDPEVEPNSVVFFIDEFLDETDGDEEEAFFIAIKRAKTTLEMEYTPATHIGLPNPGTPIGVRTWVMNNQEPVFDFNHQSGRAAIWLRSLPVHNQGGVPA